MNWFSFLGAGASSDSDCAIPAIFPFPIACDLFVRTDILSTYEKILTDTFERTNGIPSEYQRFLFDNCLQSESNHGLISLLARAMAQEQDLFIVLKAGVLRRATQAEEFQIRRDYQTRTESDIGLWVSFRDYQRTKMLVIYSTFEYCILSSLNKQLNLAKAIQVKFSKLRTGTALSDSTIAIGQAKAVALALGKGSDIAIDVEDEIATASVDTSSGEKSIAFLDSKRAFILGLPISYVSGIQTPGIGSTGEADMRAVERGLKQYFTSIARPVCKALFGVEVKFKSQDFRQFATAFEAIKTFELVDDNLVSIESKREIVARLFDIDLDEEKKRLAEAEEQDDGDPVRSEGDAPAGDAEEDD